MKRFAAVVLVAVAATTMIGCATVRPTPHQFAKTFQLGSNFDDVWAATVQTFAELNLPIESIEKESGLITTERILLGWESEYCDCGKPGLFGTDFDRTVRFNAFLRSDAGGAATLTINADFQVNRNNSMTETTTMVPCESTGVFELRIKDKVAEKLGGPVG